MKSRVLFRELSLEVADGVYEPREDTALMADCMCVAEGDRVLDVGTGSGVLSLLVVREGADVLGVDIDEAAVECARRNAEANNLEVRFIESDLFSSVDDVFDVVLFNAPYLPVNEDLPGANTWAGGDDGRQVLRRFARGLGVHLRGRAFVLISSLTGLDETIEMFEDEGFDVYVVGERKVPWETLYCLRVE